MIFRFIFIILLVSIIPFFHYWKYQDFGLITFEFFDRSMVSNLIGLFTAFALVYFFLRFIAWFLRVPSMVIKKYKDKNFKKGMKSLQEAFTASVIGDSDLLKIAVDDLRNYWGVNPIQKYYLALLAKSSGDDNEYQKNVTDLINDPKGVLLGSYLRSENLLMNKNYEAAYQTLKQMLDDSPYSEWALKNLILCAGKLSKFDDAENYIKMAERSRVITKEKINKMESEILTLKGDCLPQDTGLLHEILIT